MKLLQKTLLAVTAGAFMTVGAQAAMNYNTAEPYLGVKVGQYDLDGAEDEATSYGVYGGAKFTPNFGVEAEYMTTSDEDFKTGTFTNSEYNGEMYGLYATGNYYFPNTNGIYAKGRVGVAKNEVEVDSKVSGTNAKISSGSESETGIAGGLGLGYDFTPNAAVEIAYDWYPSVDDVAGEDLDASGITLGANFKF